MPTSTTPLSILLTLLCAATVSACGPSLDQVRSDATWLKSSRRCAQGPFEIPLQTLGFRWGEGLDGRLVADHAVHARWELWIDGKRRTHGRIRTRRRVATASSRSTRPIYRWVLDKTADNQRCMERPGELVTGESPEEPTVQPGPPAPRPAELRPPELRPPELRPPELRPPTTYVRVAPAPELRPTTPLPVRRPTAVAVFVAASKERPLEDRHGARFLRWSYRDTRLDGAKPLAKGVSMVLKIWSAEPQDWRGVRVRVQQFGYRPDVPEAEWRAYLEEKRATRLRERAERRRDQAVDRKKVRRRWRKKRAVKAKRAAFCRSHTTDEDCWGAGGLAGYRVRQRKRSEAQRQRRIVRRAKIQVSRKRWAAERARRAALPKPPRTAPPAANVEDPGPQPSQRAEWVDGFWQWTGYTWVWLSGWWKVPDVDVRAQATVVAPMAPPDVRVEVRGPPPCVGAIWMAGHWVWHLHSWVWRGGRWTLAPRGRVKVRWRRSRWIKLPGGKVRLDPGRWLRALLR